jgi:hypothetical protein
MTILAPGNDGYWRRVMTILAPGDDGYWRRVMTILAPGNDGYWRRVMTILASGDEYQIPQMLSSREMRIELGSNKIGCN